MRQYNCIIELCCDINGREIQMDNPETLTTLGTQDTGRNKLNKQKQTIKKQKQKQNKNKKNIKNRKINTKHKTKEKKNTGELRFSL